MDSLESPRGDGKVDDDRQMDKDKDKDKDMYAKRSNGAFAVWLLLVLVVGGIIAAVCAGSLRLSDTAKTALGLKPAVETERAENLLAVTRQLESVLGDFRKDAASARAWLEKTNKELSDNAAAFNASRAATETNEAALRKAVEAAGNRDYREAGFYYSHALLREPGSLEILFPYADMLEALIRQNIDANQPDEGMEFVEQLEQMLNGSLFAVSPDNVEPVRERLRRVDAFREQLLALEGADAEMPAALAKTLAALDKGVAPRWSRNLSPGQSLTEASIAPVLAEREEAYRAAYDSGRSVADGRYAELGLEIRKYHVLLADIEAEKEFNRYWAAAEMERNDKPDLAAVLLQGAETAFRRRVELDDQLPPERRRSIAADLRRLQDQSRILASAALEQAQKPAFDAAVRMAGDRLGSARKWTPPTIKKPVLAADLAKNWDKFGAELVNYDKGKQGACQRQLASLGETLAELESRSGEITAPQFRRTIEELAVNLNQEVMRVRKNQIDLYNRWATGRISATWRYAISFVGYVWDDEKSWADALVHGMAGIDTQLLSRDAYLLFNTVHDKLFSHMEDASKAAEEKEEKFKLNLVHRFLETEKVRFEDF
jgi:hypothetical protein